MKLMYICPYRVSRFVYFYNFYLLLRKNTHLFHANGVDSDQMPHFAASDLGLHCLPKSTPIRCQALRRLTWVCTVCLGLINGALCMTGLMEMLH